MNNGVALATPALLLPVPLVYPHTHCMLLYDCQW